MPPPFRRSLALMGAFCLLASACRGAADAPTSCTGSPMQLRDKGTLNLGVDFTYPPFAFVDGHGNQMGLEVEIVRAVAAEMRLKFAVVNRTSAVLIPLVLAHRFDVAASGLRDSKALKEQACLSEPYMPADLGVLARIDRKVGGIRGYRVATLRDSRASAWLREHMRDVHFRQYPAEEDVLEALKTGDIDVALDELALARFAQKRTGGALHIAQTISTGENYVFATSNDNGGLSARIDAALEKLKANGKLAEIEKKWLGA